MNMKSKMNTFINSKRQFMQQQFAGKRNFAGGGDGIGHDIPYNGIWEQFTTFPKRKPYLTNIYIATGKTAL